MSNRTHNRRPNASDSYRELLERAERLASGDRSEPSNVDVLEYMSTGFITVPDDHLYLFADFDSSRKMMKAEQELEELRDRLLKAAQAKEVDQRARTARLLLDDDTFLPFVGDDELPTEDFTDRLIDTVESITSGSVADEDEGGVPEKPLLTPTRPLEVQVLEWEIHRRKAAEEKAAEAIPLTVMVEDTPEIREKLAEIKRHQDTMFQKRMRVDFVGVPPEELRKLDSALAGEVEQFKDRGEEFTSTFISDRRVTELLCRSLRKLTFYPEDRDPVVHDLSGWGPVEMRPFAEKLPEMELERLLEAVQGVSYAAVLVDLSTTAGFPGGRSESEEE